MTKYINIHVIPKNKDKYIHNIICTGGVIWACKLGKTSANYTFIHFLIFILYCGTLILIIKTEKNR